MSDSPAAPAPSAPVSSPSSAPSPAPSAPSAPVAAKATTPEVNALPPSPSGDKTPASQGGDTPAGNNHPDAKPGETKAETVQRIKLKLKVDGKESEQEYTPEQLTLLAQKGLASDERFSKAAEIQKTFASFMQAVKEDPFGAFKDPAFKDLGDFKQLVIDSLAKEFEAEELKKKDPREYELNELRQFKSKQEAQAKAAEEARQLAAQEESDKRMWEETKKSWTAELTKSGFAEHPHLIMEMAKIGQAFHERGMDLHPSLIVAELKNRISAQNKHVLGGLKGAALVNYLGDDVINDIIATKGAELEKTRGAPPPLPTATPETAKTDAEDEGLGNSRAALNDLWSFMRPKK